MLPAVEELAAQGQRCVAVVQSPEASTRAKAAGPGAACGVDLRVAMWRSMSASPRVLTLCALLLMACGGSKPAGPTADQKAAEVTAAAKAKAAEDEVAIAARKAKREAEEKAKAEAEAKLTAEFERLCVLPEKLPKDPVAACEAVGKAHDAFVRRIGDAAAIAAWEGGGSDKALPMTVVRCTQADSLKTAACQKNALDGAGPELKDEVGKMMQLCIDKFAKKGQPPAGMPQRRPG